MKPSPTQLRLLLRLREAGGWAERHLVIMSEWKFRWSTLRVCMAAGWVYPEARSERGLTLWGDALTDAGRAVLEAQP